MRRTVAATLGAVGLLVLVIGTFLPWLRSGTAERNSYRAGSALRRLLGWHGWSAAALDAWPYIGLWCAAAVASYLLGRHAWALGAAVVAAAAGLAVAIASLEAKDSSYVRAEAAGPRVTILGACLVLVAVTLWLLPARRGR